MNNLELFKEDLRKILDERALAAMYRGEDVTAYPVAREVICSVIDIYISDAQRGKERKTIDSI